MPFIRTQNYKNGLNYIISAPRIHRKNAPCPTRDPLVISWLTWHFNVKIKNMFEEKCTFLIFKNCYTCIFLIRRHMTQYHKETNMGLHVCNICHDEFVSGTYLRKHIFKAHEADRSKWPFKCNYCGKGFTNAPGLYPVVGGAWGRGLEGRAGVASARGRRPQQVAIQV